MNYRNEYLPNSSARERAINVLQSVELFYYLFNELDQKRLENLQSKRDCPIEDGELSYFVEEWSDLLEAVIGFAYQTAFKKQSNKDSLAGALLEKHYAEIALSNLMLNCENINFRNKNILKKWKKKLPQKYNSFKKMQKLTDKNDYRNIIVWNQS